MIRIYSSDTWPSRIFWCLVVVTCLVLFLLHSGMMLEFYHSKPTFRQYTDEPLQLEDLPFITICKENGYTAMKNISLKEEEFDVAFRVMRQEFLTVDEYEILRRLENERRVTAEELYTSLSLTCKELLKTLKVSGKGYDACEFASEDLTEYGVCWTVGKWPARRANDRVEIVIKNTKPASNIIVHVHSRLVQPSVMAKGLYIPKDRIAHMIVQPNMVDSLEIGSWGTCSKEWSSKIHLG
ncbi:unnamed protein product, partial [Mesorhabditis belari]|uniref:Uncharacterized protein n=1 Tax=Mesorhabditis belari TaxID=2138241 RepID=A0AAF3FQA8_9BILA